MGVLPIAAKWTLIGRWKPRQIPIWSAAYLRFWLVKSLIRSSPMVIFVGTPLYSFYLRALGAKIGRGAVILSSRVPVCTDLLSVGAGTVVRRDSLFSGYRARAGLIETGTICIGRHAFIGEQAVLDIDTKIGDYAQLGHASALWQGQAVPDDQRWHGSPAQRTDVDYLRLYGPERNWLRPLVYGIYQVLSLIVGATLFLGLVGGILIDVDLTYFLALGPRELVTWSFVSMLLVVSLVWYVGGVLSMAVVAFTVPRLLTKLITAGTTYPLYGLRHAIFRAVHRLTNNSFLLQLTGDSSYVVNYLQALGYRLPGLQQTGSNFGAQLHHETPFLVEIGGSTMVSDGVSLMNAEYSATAFRAVPVTIGHGSFLGNAIAYPAGGRIGSNCLVATKAMVPLDGPLREGVGLLGSPSFEIPRAVGDTRFEHLATGEEFHRRLAAKNRHNLVTVAVFLLARWFHLVLGLVLGSVTATAVDWRQPAQATIGMALATVGFGVISFAYFIVIERAVLRFGSLRPRYCSIYEPYFWLHERYWKMLSPFVNLFNGTPVRGVLFRLAGVKIGKRVFDDGCAIPERMLVTIGDDCTLNAESTVQCHSMEDGIFKSDYTVVEAGATIGVACLVHYGVTVGREAEVLADSFVMKGETVPPAACWGGNPAQPL
jgi:non-ribosomal peptide synthetase-like protein